jgi:hypothetical protein
LKFSVFISHSSKDAALATELCRLLEAHSITCWIAPRNIVSGTSYGEGIAKAIEQVSVVLLLLTQPANHSRAVANELELGFRYQKTIVPIRVSAIEPSKSIEFFVSNAQWVDAITSPLKKRVAELVRIVKAIELGEKTPDPIPEENSFFSRLERLLEQTFIHKFMAVGLLFIVVFLILFGIYKKVSFTETSIENQQVLIQQDPSTFGLVNLQPLLNENKSIALQATVYLNLKNASKSSVEYKSMMENEVGEFGQINLNMGNKTPNFTDPLRLTFLVPDNTKKVIFCIQATHPDLNSPYEASWSFKLEKSENDIQINRLGDATMHPLSFSNCDFPKNQSIK